jgi:hypothetical protein
MGKLAEPSSHPLGILLRLHLAEPAGDKVLVECLKAVADLVQSVAQEVRLRAATPSPP